MKKDSESTIQAIGYNRGWNAAIDAAVKLFSEGYTWVRRGVDDEMKCKIEIYPGDYTVAGDYEEATYVTSSEHDVAAIQSLRRVARMR